MESEFTRRLSSEDDSGDCAFLTPYIGGTTKLIWQNADNTFFEYTKALSPAALDLEIRSLISLDHLSLFIHALTQRLKSHRDFEAVQALLSVFLTVHADILMANSELRDRLGELKDAQRKESKRLGELVSYAMGTLGFLRSAG